MRLDMSGHQGCPVHPGMLAMEVLMNHRAGLRFAEEWEEEEGSDEPFFGDSADPDSDSLRRISHLGILLIDGAPRRDERGIGSLSGRRKGSGRRGKLTRKGVVLPSDAIPVELPGDASGAEAVETDRSVGDAGYPGGDRFGGGFA